MSATLGMLLKELDPSLTIEIFERLDSAAAESSDAWNNAGKGQISPTRLIIILEYFSLLNSPHLP